MIQIFEGVSNMLILENILDIPYGINVNNINMIYF